MPKAKDRKLAASKIGTAVISMIMNDPALVRLLLSVAPKANKPATAKSKSTATPSGTKLLAAVAAVGKQADAQPDGDGVVWVRATKVAERLGVETSVARKGLGELVRAERLLSKGKAAGTRYALPVG